MPVTGLFSSLSALRELLLWRGAAGLGASFPEVLLGCLWLLRDVGAADLLLKLLRARAVRGGTRVAGEMFSQDTRFGWDPGTAEQRCLVTPPQPTAARTAFPTRVGCPPFRASRVLPAPSPTANRNVAKLPVWCLLPVCFPRKELEKLGRVALRASPAFKHGFISQEGSLFLKISI